MTNIVDHMAAALQALIERIAEPKELEKRKKRVKLTNEESSEDE